MVRKRVQLVDGKRLSPIDRLARRAVVVEGFVRRGKPNTEVLAEEELDLRLPLERDQLAKRLVQPGVERRVQAEPAHAPGLPCLGSA